MAITGIGNNYENMYESTYASSKNESVKDAKTKENSATAEKDNKTTNKSSQTQSAKSSASSKVADYYSYLAKKYDCVKNGKVAISGTYLRECANDPEKAKELEENLSLYKDICKQGYESAKQNARKLGARLVSYNETWSIDSKGRVSAMVATTVESEGGGKSRKEIQEERLEKLKEKKEEAKKEEKIKIKKEEKQEQLEELMEAVNMTNYVKFEAEV